MKRHHVFRSLKQKFEEASRRFPKFKIYPYKLHDSEGLCLPEILAEMQRKSFQSWGGGATSGGCSGWSIHNYDERELVHAVGSSDAFTEWEKLAKEAGASLPEGCHRIQPILPFSENRMCRGSPEGLWGNFVFTTLKAAGGMHVNVCEKADQTPFRRARQSLSISHSQPAPPDSAKYATYAFTATDIFAAFALAIDFAGLAEPCIEDSAKVLQRQDAMQNTTQVSKVEDGTLSTPQEAKGNNRPKLTAAEMEAIQAEKLALSLGREDGSLSVGATDEDTFNWLNDHHDDDRVKPFLPVSLHAFKQSLRRARKKLGTGKRRRATATGKSVVRKNDLETVSRGDD